MKGDLNVNLYQLWQFINSNIISGLLLLFLGILVSVKIVDSFRARMKRKTMLAIVSRELDELPEFKPILHTHDFRMTIDDYFYKEILSSDVFNYSKDKLLLIRLHELCSLIGMYNTLTDNANISLVSRHEKSRDPFTLGSDELLKKIISKKETLLSIMSKEYRIKKLDIS